jgi:hypothetical protein
MPCQHVLAPMTGTGPPQAAKTAVTAGALPRLEPTWQAPGHHGTWPHMPSRTVISIGSEIWELPRLSSDTRVIISVYSRRTGERSGPAKARRTSRSARLRETGPKEWFRPRIGRPWRGARGQRSSRSATDVPGREHLDRRPSALAVMAYRRRRHADRPVVFRCLPTLQG